MLKFQAVFEKFAKSLKGYFFDAPYTCIRINIENDA